MGDTTKELIKDLPTREFAFWCVGLMLPAMNFGCGDPTREFTSQTPAVVSSNGNQTTQITSCRVTDSTLRFHGRISNTGSVWFYIVRETLLAPAINDVVTSEKTIIASAGEGLPLPQQTLYLEDQIVLAPGEFHDSHFDVSYELQSQNSLLLNLDDELQIAGNMFSIRWKFADSWDFNVRTASGKGGSPHKFAYRGCPSTNAITVEIADKE